MGYLGDGLFTVGYLGDGLFRRWVILWMGYLGGRVI